MAPTLAELEARLAAKGAELQKAQADLAKAEARSAKLKTYLEGFRAQAVSTTALADKYRALQEDHGAVQAALTAAQAEAAGLRAQLAREATEAEKRLNAALRAARQGAVSAGGEGASRKSQPEAGAAEPEGGQAQQQSQAEVLRLQQTVGQLRAELSAARDQLGHLLEQQEQQQALADAARTAAAANGTASTAAAGGRKRGGRGRGKSGPNGAAGSVARAGESSDSEGSSWDGNTLAEPAPTAAATEAASAGEAGVGDGKRHRPPRAVGSRQRRDRDQGPSHNPDPEREAVLQELQRLRQEATQWRQERKALTGRVEAAEAVRRTAQAVLAERERQLEAAAAREAAQAADMEEVKAQMQALQALVSQHATALHQHTAAAAAADADRRKLSAAVANCGERLAAVDVQLERRLAQVGEQAAAVAEATAGAAVAAVEARLVLQLDEIAAGGRALRATVGGMAVQLRGVSRTHRLLRAAFGSGPGGGGDPDGMEDDADAAFADLAGFRDEEAGVGTTGAGAAGGRHQQHQQQQGQLWLMAATAPAATGAPPRQALPPPQAQGQGQGQEHRDKRRRLNMDPNQHMGLSYPAAAAAGPRTAPVVAPPQPQPLPLPASRTAPFTATTAGTAATATAASGALALVQPLALVRRSRGRPRKERPPSELLATLLDGRASGAGQLAKIASAAARRAAEAVRGGVLHPGPLAAALCSAVLRCCKPQLGLQGAGAAGGATAAEPGAAAAAASVVPASAKPGERAAEAGGSGNDIGISAAQGSTAAGRPSGHSVSALRELLGPLMASRGAARGGAAAGGVKAAGAGPGGGGSSVGATLQDAVCGLWCRPQEQQRQVVRWLLQVAREADVLIAQGQQQVQLQQEGRAGLGHGQAVGPQDHEGSDAEAGGGGGATDAPATPAKRAAALVAAEEAVAAAGSGRAPAGRLVGGLLARQLRPVACAAWLHQHLQHQPGEASAAAEAGPAAAVHGGGTGSGGSVVEQCAAAAALGQLLRLYRDRQGFLLSAADLVHAAADARRHRYDQHSKLGPQQRSHPHDSTSHGVAGGGAACCRHGSIVPLSCLVVSWPAAMAAPNSAKAVAPQQRGPGHNSHTGHSSGSGLWDAGGGAAEGALVAAPLSTALQVAAQLLALERLAAAVSELQVGPVGQEGGVGPGWLLPPLPAELGAQTEAVAAAALLRVVLEQHQHAQAHTSAAAGSGTGNAAAAKLPAGDSARASEGGGCGGASTAAGSMAPARNPSIPLPMLPSLPRLLQAVGVVKAATTNAGATPAEPSNSSLDEALTASLQEARSATSELAGRLVGLLLAAAPTSEPGAQTAATATCVLASAAGGGAGQRSGAAAGPYVSALQQALLVLCHLLPYEQVYGSVLAPLAAALMAAIAPLGGSAEGGLDGGAGAAQQKPQLQQLLETCSRSPTAVRALGEAFADVACQALLSTQTSAITASAGQGAAAATGRVLRQGLSSACEQLAGRVAAVPWPSPLPQSPPAAAAALVTPGLVACLVRVAGLCMCEPDTDLPTVGSGNGVEGHWHAAVNASVLRTLGLLRGSLHRGRSVRGRAPGSGVGVPVADELSLAPWVVELLEQGRPGEEAAGGGGGSGAEHLVQVEAGHGETGARPALHSAGAKAAAVGAGDWDMEGGEDLGGPEAGHGGGGDSESEADGAGGEPPGPLQFEAEVAGSDEADN